MQVTQILRSPQDGTTSHGPLSSKRKAAILAVLCISILMTTLDNTVLNVALPTLARQLHSTVSDLQWIVDAYTLVFAGLEITAGNIGDRYGRKGILFGGMAVFGLGSAMSAFSTSSSELIAFRCVMGVGGAFVMPATLAVIMDVFVDPHERAKAIGIWSGASGLGVAIGPILGGILLAHYWWGSVFLINVPIVVFGLVAIAFLVPPSRDPRTRPPDPIGSMLSIAGIGMLVWGIIDVPINGWGDPTVPAAMAAGAVIMGLMVLWERHSAHPMLNMSLFKKRRFTAAAASLTLTFFALAGVMFLMTQYMQSVLGYSPIHMGFAIAPVSVLLAGGAVLSSFLVPRIGTKIVVSVGLGAIIVGLLLLSSLTVKEQYTSLLAPLFLIGAGVGIAMPPSTDSIMGSFSHEESGVGSAMNGTALQLGGTLGVAVIGSMLNARYRAGITPLLVGQKVPAQALHYIEGSLAGALAVAGYVSSHVNAKLGVELAAVAKHYFTIGVNQANLIGAGCTFLGVLIAFIFLPSRPHPEDQAREAERLETAKRSYKTAPNTDSTTNAFAEHDHEVGQAESSASASTKHSGNMPNHIADTDEAGTDER